MRFFGQNYDKPGPGVPKDQPRKKGIPRVFELLVREHREMIKLNLIFALIVLPSRLLLLLTGLFWGDILSLLFAGLTLLAFIPIGSARTALMFCITKMLRDDPGYIGYDFRRTFVSNFRVTVVPGIVHELVFSAQLIILTLILSDVVEGNLTAVIFASSAVIFSMIAPYFFLQAGYVELKILPLLKNSFFLSFMNIPRSFGGALLGDMLVLAFSALVMLTVLDAVVLIILVFVTVLIGYSIPAFFCLSFIWPPVDKVFSIEETLRNRNEELYSTENTNASES